MSGKTIFLTKTLRIDHGQTVSKESDTKGEITVFVPKEDFESQLKIAGMAAADASANSFDFQGTFRLTGFKPLISGRGHASRCFGGREFSVTLRSDELRKVKIPSGKAILDKCLSLDEKEVYPSNRVLYNALTCSAKSSLQPISSKGLLLIAGETGSGKTEALKNTLTLHLRARIQEYRKLRGVQTRLPHVVAIGDPVETLYFHGKKKSLLNCTSHREDFRRPFDFTARQLVTDVGSVYDALEDALRETPEAVVVNELRSRKDFEAALDFAATGHLILATCHSGSLVEVFARLLDLWGQKKSASNRAALVHRLAAVVHIQKLGEKLRIPTVWRPTLKSRQDFISEGLSSIIAASPRSTLDDLSRGVLGRYWVLQQMLRSHLAKLGIDTKGEFLLQEDLEERARMLKARAKKKESLTPAEKGILRIVPELKHALAMDLKGT